MTCPHIATSHTTAEYSSLWPIRTNIQLLLSKSTPRIYEKYKALKESSHHRREEYANFGMAINTNIKNIHQCASFAELKKIIKHL